jgi:hypothetical protein
MTFDRDTTLTFKIHVVQQLVLFLTSRNRSGMVEQSIGKRAFPVIDVRNDAKVANVLHSFVLRLLAGCKYRANSTRANDEAPDF